MTPRGSAWGDVTTSSGGAALGVDRRSALSRSAFALRSWFARSISCQRRRSSSARFHLSYSSCVLPPSPTRVTLSFLSDSSTPRHTGHLVTVANSLSRPTPLTVKLSFPSTICTPTTSLLLNPPDEASYRQLLPSYTSPPLSRYHVQPTHLRSFQFCPICAPCILRYDAACSSSDGRKCATPIFTTPGPFRSNRTSQYVHPVF
mmetsp:Transcript_23336/g.46843  ORF Transcript_23336/g.46843 Transcript_23336/m.46843 type:complete len:203 (-) Transcript_23336:696-1304(-)